MFEVILKATNSSFKKGKTFCRSIYANKVMKLLALIFEQPSYFGKQWNCLIWDLFFHACMFGSLNYLSSCVFPSSLLLSGLVVISVAYM